MATGRSPHFDRVLGKLGEDGVLLESDPKLPSVVSIIVGHPVRGSWWGHPRSHDIHRVTGELAAHEDVLVARLVSGKVTYIHRALWPAFFAVATAQEAWQREGLSKVTRRLLDLVERDGEARTNLTGTLPNPGEAARELERRLLVHSRQVHTEAGAHAKHLETWQRWAHRCGFDPRPLPPPEAQQALEEVVRRLYDRFGSRNRLPWQT